MSIVNVEALKQNGCQLWWPGAVASANSPKAITANGDVKQLLPFPGAGIGMFDGTGDYLMVPASVDFVQNGTMSIGGFVYLKAYPASGTGSFIYTIRYDGDNSNALYINNTSGTYTLKFERYHNGSLVINIAQTISPQLNTWYSFLITSDGSTIKLWFNDVLLTSVSSAASLNVISNTPVHIGKWAGGDGGYLNGYLSEFFIKSGGPVVTSIPKRQLESDSNTKLLIHFNRNDTTFIDSSPSAHTITTYGDAKQLCSPCGSGVAYFDGTGDYLTTPDHSDWDFGSNSWSIECRFNILSANASGRYLLFVPYNGFSCIQIYVLDGKLGCYFSSNGTTFLNGSNTAWATTLSYGVFYDMKLIRTPDGYIKGYLNGIEDFSYNIGTTSICSPNQAIIIGRYPTGIAYWNGYISEYRISTIDRTSVPSTQPFKPDPYTKLLLHMDGTGNAFYDSSDPPGDNGFPILPDGVTVTPTGTFAVEKMKDGRNIWKFDGSTNYVSLSDHDAWTFYNNDFTLCFWINHTAFKTEGGILGQWASNSAWWGVEQCDSTQFIFYTLCPANSYYRITGLSLSTNTWYHFTIVRSGSSCLMYINGVAQTVTITTAFPATIQNVAAPLIISKNYNTNSRSVNGNIKDLMIFKGKALTQDQIAAIYKETFIY